MKVLAPMAGITDGLFCSKLAPQGFDMVTTGGFNVDRKTLKAGKSIIQRGRPEFEIPQNQILPFIERQINVIKENSTWKGMISVNLRSTTPSPIIEVSNIGGVDVVEINAHCRQPEIMELGCGQSLLHNPDKLFQFTREVVEKSGCKVSVKIRANVPDTDIYAVSKSVENAGADFLHVDAMKPGFPHADYEVITSIKDSTNIFLIGNNSIKDVNSARKMLNAGADGISMARVVLNGELPFTLSSI
ncbi:MAG TPA: MJ0144 family RNA dihydrouridine synthase-like protein [Methanobacterium sp.]|nr:MJ0144 family RNA dihydrouridine synthase-like protein [Methanobacterium sp.]